MTSIGIKISFLYRNTTTNLNVELFSFLGIFFDLSIRKRPRVCHVVLDVDCVKAADLEAAPLLASPCPLATFYLNRVHVSNSFC